MQNYPCCHDSCISSTRLLSYDCNFYEIGTRNPSCSRVLSRDWGIIKIWSSPRKKKNLFYRPNDFRIFIELKMYFTLLIGNLFSLLVQLITYMFLSHIKTVHSKTSGSDWPGKESVEAKLQSGSKKMTRNMVLLIGNGVTSDPIPSLHDHIPGHFFFLPERSLAPTDSFPGQTDPDVFSVNFRKNTTV